MLPDLDFLLIFFSKLKWPFFQRKDSNLGSFQARDLKFFFYTPFLGFKSLWGFWKGSQIISHTQKPWVRHQNQVSSLLRTKVWYLLRDLLYPILDVHQNRVSIMFRTNDSNLLLKLVRTSYISFLTFRSILGLWKWSQMIPHTQKPGVRHQNQVSIMFRTKVRNFLLDMVLDLLHPILNLQVNLRHLKMVSKWFPIPKNIWFDTKIKSVPHPEPKLKKKLLDVVLDLLHPILDVKVNLRLLKMVPNDSPYPKT